tara:strand:- start:195 stop:1064 length:870 start_codon:yes stop_codon:yes gene_type:complete
MDFLTGYTLKPYEITSLGEVLFTDGTTNDLMVNQVTCEAYGYKYNSSTGMCESFRLNPSLSSTIQNINNKNNGPRNSPGIGSNTVQINGANNTTRGFNTNCFINGSNNEIANGVTDATVLGVGGKASSNGEIVIGGGLKESELSSTTWSDRKVSVINLTGVTEDNTPTLLTVNGGGGFINVSTNSIVGFEIYITRFENGEGSSGTAGNYSYRNIKGVVQIDNTGAMAFIVGFTRNIGKIGVNGSAAMVDSSTAGKPPHSITLEVTDRNNVTNIWSATVTLHELTSNITF